MKKKCIICNGTPYNEGSNLCSECFANLLKDKIKEEDKIELPSVKSL